ncbi:MAG: hypothetical protein WCP45_19140 [Verrucomicrobiota bacterium]
MREISEKGHAPYVPCVPFTTAPASPPLHRAERQSSGTPLIEPPHIRIPYRHSLLAARIPHFDRNSKWRALHRLPLAFGLTRRHRASG